MATWTNNTKNSATFTNVAKSLIDGFLLQENGDLLLQENGDKIILEQSVAEPPTYTNITKS